MNMKIGEEWRCTNPACHCEVLVWSNSKIEGSNPLCVCGSPMKKKYTPPNFAYLEFLRVEDLVSAQGGSRRG